MSSAEKIKHLKLIIGAVDVTQPREAWPAPSLNEGVPKGCVVELLGAKKYEWFISFLKTNPELSCFWCEREQQVLPTALVQRGVNLENMHFAILGENDFLSLRKIIQSQVFQAVITTQNFKDLKSLRALQLLTEKSNTTLFLANHREPSEAWPIALQMEIKSGSGSDFTIDVLRRKYGRSE